MSDRLAIESLKAQLRKVAFDASLYDRGIADSEHAKHCSQRRRQLQAEIARLNGEKTERPRPMDSAPRQLALMD